jgi:uncharacterized protein YfaS (alpha-2-macroglobulin family)
MAASTPLDGRLIWVETPGFGKNGNFPASRGVCTTVAHCPIVDFCPRANPCHSYFKCVMSKSRFFVAGLAVAILGGFSAMVYSNVAAPPERTAVNKLYSDGNYKDAYEGYRALLLGPNVDPRASVGDLDNAVACLRNLGRQTELDAFRQAVVEAQPKNWRLLQAVASSYLYGESYGVIIAGKFERGPHRGGRGRVVNSYERDRVKALQLMQQGMPHALADNKSGAASYLLTFARMFLGNRGNDESWRLQVLTNLAELPDYEDGWHRGSQQRGAPVDAEGNPIFYHVPKSYEAATSDGERWRWCLSQAKEVDASTLNQVRHTIANFLQNQFGVQTLAIYGYGWGQPDDDGDKDESGTYALHTLGEDETIARLATGIKRFKLPDEFNYIKVLFSIADDPKTGFGNIALDTLAAEFTNRRQYPRAAEIWRRAIAKYGPGSGNSRQIQLDQIVKNWGRFEPISTQPAGKGATIDFRFRNGKQVSFEAHAIKIDKLLDDVKAYLKSRPNQLDWERLNIQDFGFRLVQQNEQKYLGEKVATWDLELEPRAAHVDRRITVSTPLQKAGAYLLTAKMADGNVSKIVLWVADTAIVKKPLKEAAFYYVADAVTGKPIEKANVEFFGYQQKHIRNNQFQINTLNFAEFTDADGQVITTAKNQPSDYQWIVIARTDKGRLAYMGFTNVWYQDYYDQQYNEAKVFTITDRPVYRPDQAVKFKFWVRHAKYDQEDTSSFANQDFNVELHDPMGNKVLEKRYHADEYGGFEGEYALPKDAKLGTYQVTIVGHGGGSFRVEEYKKPEFEVEVKAPTEPVMLGEKIKATIKARYYFGAPVTNAKVKYKITRTTYNSTWYPVGPWDWFYGQGYWWFACDYPWYPGWANWGCRRPIAWWWPQRSWTPPELVAEQEVPIGEDGTVQVEIDTQIAKEIHPDQDQQYSITAEVVDESRRTIVGQGNVLVARKPFKVYVWVNRGHYRVGDVVQADIQAQTLDRQPVQGTGALKLLKISYDENRQPVEKLVRSWDLNTDAQGRATQQLKASEAGQYRLSYTLTDKAGHKIEGGYLFTVTGEGFDGKEFRFNELELILDKKEYAPGDKVQLMVNTDRADTAVLLFVRPSNGVYLKPKLVRLEGKSTVEAIEVAKRDMPNFFVEAVTIHEGKVFSEMREVVVPPEKRVLDVAIEPSQKEFLPGQQAKVKIKLTDATGEPFVGSTVLTMYDKSVEYISGGSNVPEIKAFFWKWRRNHHSQSENTLDRYGHNMTLPGQVGMSDLGIFGAGVVEEMEDRAAQAFNGPGAGRHGGFGGGAMQMRKSAAVPMAAPMMAARAMEADAATAFDGAHESAEKAKNADGQAAGPNLVQPTIRSQFADTALWVGSLTTGKDGTAEVSLKMPENLTTWKIRVWGMGHGTKVGQGDAEVVTRKNLIVRLQAPRFFVQKDEVVLSANVHNYLEKAKSCEVVLELDGGTLKPMGELKRTIEIPAGGEQRVDWRVKVVEEGEAVVRMKALTDEESDATEQKFPVYVHGMLKMESYAGAIRPEQNGQKFDIRVPSERRINQSRLEIRYSPTLAGAMVDALPYLVDYPYGCTEQTLNRFLPTVITQKILLGMGLNLKDIQQKRTNLNAQELGDAAERAKQWKRFDRNPVFDEAEVREMVKSGVQKLTDMQLSDGGWGWFSGWGEHSYAHTTATVVHGLQIAKANDVALVPGVLERGVAWLKNYQDAELQKLNNADGKKDPWKDRADNLDAFVYMVLVDAGIKNDGMKNYLYRDRTHLAVYATAMFGIALHAQNEAEKLDMIMRNIGQFVVQDDENQTAYLKLPENNWWWCWYGSEYEAQAYYLKLLSRTDAKGELASRLVKYLLNNRKHATYWNSTRDTAICIEAMAEYLKASGENKPDMTVEVWLDGKQRKSVKITAADLFTFDNAFVLEGDAVADGVHTVEFKKAGTGPLYWNAYLTNFTLEDPIASAGLEIKVARKFYKLVKVDKSIKVAGSRGQAVDQKVEKYERKELVNFDTLKSGDLIEVELEIDSKNDYEYLMFEDMKAAGCEAVDIRSGYNGNDLGAYMELRDNRVTFFTRTLARGRNSVAYRLRAEIPGKFSALPTRASAMYAPELKANSDEFKIQIAD